MGALVDKIQSVFRPRPVLQFVPTERIPGQGSRAMKEFARLQLSVVDINKFYTCFCDCDTDEGGSISIGEFFAVCFQARIFPCLREHSLSLLVK